MLTRQAFSLSMFSKLAADITGSADVCKVIPAEQIPQEVCVTYLLPGEKAYILLKSKKEEHIFTNLAYICCKGESAANTRRLTSRYNYYDAVVRDVQFETAGISVTDRDCELKFVIGGKHVSIDIWKNETEVAKGIYKTVVELSNHMVRNETLMNFAHIALGSSKNENPLNDNGFISMQWAEAVNARYKPESYEHVFQAMLK